MCICSRRAYRETRLYASCIVESDKSAYCSRKLGEVLIGLDH